MRKRFRRAITSVILSSVMLTGCGSGNDTFLNGAFSEEKAVQNFVSAFLDADVDGVLAASAPDKFWDSLAHQSGLTPQKLFYEFVDFDDENDFISTANEWKMHYIEENISVKDNKIEEKNDADNEVFSLVSLAMQDAGIDEEVENVYGS